MNRCPMCYHPVHLAFACTECNCELDAIEAYDGGGGDFEFELPVGSYDRRRLEGDLDEEDEGAFDTEMDYEELGSMQY